VESMITHVLSCNVARRRPGVPQRKKNPLLTSSLFTYAKVKLGLEGSRALSPQLRTTIVIGLEELNQDQRTDNYL
jgi:hypothetical protein